jgi:hypothetical protein
MSDILIRRCTLRIVRHGGWTWGANRRALVEQATAALPRLIAERLAVLMPEGDGEIEDPVRLRFALQAHELMSTQALARVVASGLTAETLPIPKRKDRGASDHSHTLTKGIAAEQAQAAGELNDCTQHHRWPTPIEVLARWRAQGELWSHLQGFALPALQLWFEALLSALPARVPNTIAEPELHEECAAILRRLPAPIDHAASALRTRVMLAVEMAARHPQQIGTQELVKILDELVPVVDIDIDEGVEPQYAPADKHTKLQRGFAGPRDVSVALPLASHVSTRVDALATQNVSLCSVLPYLVLGALHRVGWLQLASATFEALRDKDGGRAFATALAYKVLPPPERGWHRSDAAMRTAAAFAGSSIAPSSADLANWGRRTAGGLSPLDDFVVAAIARGHDLSMPLLIMRVESRHGREWLLFDADGGMPIMWAEDEVSLRRSLRRFGPSVILASTGAATKPLIRGLVDDGRTFVTTAIPARDDEWRRIRGTPCWSGGAQTTFRKLAEAAALLPEVEAQALSVTRELLQSRPISASNESAELEHSAALTAATGLGALSWLLWHERETVHPLLALQRFANLDGTARFQRDVVEVRASFGRRYLDLQKHGLFADIPAPPWLDGRRIVFKGP